MGFRINSNIGSMNAYRNASQNSVGLNSSMTKLSSGLRVNTASDDSASFSIANKMSAQEQGLGQAIRNSNGAIGMIQTAEGAIKEQMQIAKRIKLLALQAANDTQDATSRAYIQSEVDELRTEYDQITSSTSFNDKVLLDGSTGALNFQIGHKGNDTKSVSITAIAAIGVQDVSTSAAALTTMTTMDTLMSTLNKNASDLGASQNSLYSVVKNISITQVNISAAESQLKDLDFAEESASFSKLNILTQSGTYALSQANNVQRNTLRLLQ